EQNQRQRRKRPDPPADTPRRRMRRDILATRRQIAQRCAVDQYEQCGDDDDAMRQRTKPREAQTGASGEERRHGRIITCVVLLPFSAHWYNGIIYNRTSIRRTIA